MHTLQVTIGFLEDWLEMVETGKSLTCSIFRVASGRGYTSMGEICSGMQAAVDTLPDNKDATLRLSVVSLIMLENFRGRRESLLGGP